MSINKILPIGYASWCGLGFYRGIKFYSYKKKENDYLYINLIGSGCIGSILYANPICIPMLLYKEFYRLEVNLRKLGNEKKSDYYNEFF